MEQHEVAFQDMVNNAETRSQANGLAQTLSGQINALNGQVSQLDDLTLYEITLNVQASERAYFGTIQQQYVDTIVVRLDMVM